MCSKRKTLDEANNHTEEVKMERKVHDRDGCRSNHCSYYEHTAFNFNICSYYWFGILFAT